MARLARLVAPHQPHHIIQRGNDRQLIFRDADDYQAFLRWLLEASKQFKVAIHAYILMPNHLHLLATPSDQTGMGRMMQWVGRHYVPYYNRKYDRVGSLWQGRFKASVIDSERYLMTCCRYIELNPVRAAIAAHPTDYLWSSYAHHVGMTHDPLITDHPLYWALGNTPFDREAVYKGLIQQALPPEEVNALTASANKGWVLGPEKFKLALERSANRRVRPAKRGRPFKQTLDKPSKETKSAP
jgi:putative transposase